MHYTTHVHVRLCSVMTGREFHYVYETCCNWVPWTVADKEKIVVAEESDVQAATKAAQESSPPQVQVLPISVV